MNNDKYSFSIAHSYDPSISFYGKENKFVGKLEVVDGKLCFSGNANAAARVFFDSFGYLFESKIDPIKTQMSNQELSDAIKYTFDSICATRYGSSESSINKIMFEHFKMLLSVQAARAGCCLLKDPGV